MTRDRNGKVFNFKKTSLLGSWREQR